MGLKSDDSIFIFADSEPGDSPDYSPPGQVYAEASAGARRVFDNKTATAALSLLLQPITSKPGVQKA
ncbi:MAG: hypothetical protein Q7U74_01520 [Saprospiraceae bacterium]|nr:hypothetical protein [Saprospiraceae bacterium]